MSSPLQKEVITPPTVCITYRGGETPEVLGWFNEYEFNDLRIRIKQGKHEGFHVLVYGDGWHPINPDGSLEHDTWSKLKQFDMINDQLCILLDCC